MAEYIERETAIEQIKNEWAKLPLTETTGFAILMRVLTSIPAADVRPVVRGKWIDMGDFISCSSCNVTRLKEFESDYGKAKRLDARTNYCPNCGAEMSDHSFLVHFNPDGTANCVALGRQQKPYQVVQVEPHGRLIDADATADRIWDLMRFPSNLANAQFFVNTLREAPTVIGAEDEK